MRVWLFIIALLALAPVALAEQEAKDLFASEKLGITMTVSSDLTLQPKGPGPMNIDYVQADLFFYPQEDTAQQVKSLITAPEAERRASALRFVWENPTQSVLRYSAASDIEVRNQFPRVSNKIPFPLTSVPAEARNYLEPTEHIDSAYPGIVTLANRLAQGKNDEFIVVSEIAIWVKNNIAYNLSTLTADVSQKASWVLQNRYGVCDELTSLFIAMLRSLGIPARFVTGVAYTSSPLFPTEWGAHGWAEVYFPSVGWIPFDPTFGEFGWVDPGHVKMIVSDDPNAPSTRFEWRGTNAQVQYREPDIDASITDVGKRMPPIVGLSIKPLYDTVGFGAFNLIQATIENLQPYYETAEIRLARVNELTVLEPYDQQVILKPFEKKTVFWRVSVSPELQERYVYTIPLGVFTVRNDSAASRFTARTQGGEHTKVEVTRAMNTLSADEDTVVARTLDMTCAADKSALYPDETAKVSCSLHNLGTTPLRSVRVCIEDKQCSALDLGIGQSRELAFTQTFTKAGATTLFVTASNADVSKNAALPFVMQDMPVINITGIDAPASIAYGKKFSLVFTLKQASQSVPKNVVLTVSTKTGDKVFEIPKLQGQQTFQIDFDSSDLSLGTTNILMSAHYEDERGRKRGATATAPVELTDVPFFPRAWLWVRGWFE